MFPRTLFLSPLLAMPQHHGGCAYPDAVLKALHATGLPLDYAWLAWPLRGDRAVMRDPLRASYVDHGHVPGTRRVGGWRFRAPGEWFARGPAESRGEDGAESLPAADEQHFFQALVRRTKPRAVLIDFTTTLPVLDGLSPAERAQLRVAVLTHNLTSRRTDLYREHGQPLDFRPLTAAAETALLERADVIVAIQEREAEAFRSMLPRKTVVTVPMPVHPKPLSAAQATPPVCLFVGGYSGHNLAGLTWLLREIWPQVIRACPEARLHIAGTLADAVPEGAPGVVRVGPVEDLRETYAAARVALAPLPMGTGLKIKVIEAMGWGRPVVTTSAGAEGFAELERGDVAVVADAPDAFAAAILRLLQSPEHWQEVVDRQLVWIGQRLTPAQAIAPLLKAWQTPASSGAVNPSKFSPPAAPSLSPV